MRQIGNKNQADDRGKSSLYVRTTTGVNIFFNCTRKQLGENVNLKEIFLSVRRKLGLKQRCGPLVLIIKPLSSGSLWKSCSQGNHMFVWLLFCLSNSCCTSGLELFITHCSIKWSHSCFLYALLMLSKYPRRIWKSIASSTVLYLCCQYDRTGLWIITQRDRKASVIASGASTQLFFLCKMWREFPAFGFECMYKQLDAARLRLEVSDHKRWD